MELKGFRLTTLLLVFALCTALLLPTTVSAGAVATTSDPILLDEDERDNANWNFTDNFITVEDGKLIISGENATRGTKFIAKNSAVAGDDMENIAVAQVNMTITQIPEGGSLILALGLQSIEAEPGEEGNVEIAFENNGSLTGSVRAYGESGEQVLSAPGNWGVAMNREFALEATISSKGVLTLTVNGREVFSGELPVTGAGRFGVLQSGSCGAVISKCKYQTFAYDRPENTDIFEDFETGEFNANLFGCYSTSSGVFPATLSIVEMDGNQVLRFRNNKTSWICTRHQYSNFEISFDVPFFLREYLYDEYGNVTDQPCDLLGVGFAEPIPNPQGYGYVDDTDLIVFASNVIRSELLKAFRTPLKGTGITDESTNVGYSVKLRVVDGHYDVYAKSLTATDYILVGSADFESQRSGYVSIWSPVKGNFAVDNIRIVNLDQDPNTVEVPYKSSKITWADYEPTPGENEKVYRPVEEEQAEPLGVMEYVAIACGAVAVILLVIGVIFYSAKKRRKG